MPDVEGPPADSLCCALRAKCPRTPDEV